MQYETDIEFTTNLVGAPKSLLRTALEGCPVGASFFWDGSTGSKIRSMLYNLKRDIGRTYKCSAVEEGGKSGHRIWRAT